MSIKHFIFGIVATLAGAWSASTPAATTSAPTANNGKANSARPKIQFESHEFDFGKVNAGELVKHDFVFTNTGTATLEILDVKPGCGCTSSGKWDREVAPGKTGVIPLQYNSTGFGGTVSKPTTVTCNDPDHATMMLTLKGTVWKPIDVTPSMAMFNLPGDGQTNETKVVRIVNNLDEPLALSDLQCTNQSFRAELKTLQPGKEFELHVTSVPPFTTPTTFAPITIKTSSAKTPVISVTAYAVVQQQVVVQPERLFLPAGPLKSSIKPSVTIRNNSTNALMLSEATVNVPGGEVRVQEVQPGTLFSLLASFPEGFQVQPGQNVEVTVKSNHPKFPVIKVPVFQAFLPPVQPTVSPAFAPRSGIQPLLRPSTSAGPGRVPAPVAAPEPPAPK